MNNARPYGPRVFHPRGKEDMTQQHKKEECDIHKMYERAVRGIPPPNKGRPMFGDFSKISDMREAQEFFLKAEEQFMQIPAEIRLKFGNDPLRLIEFLDDEKNNELAERMGLRESKGKTDKPSDTPTADPAGKAEPVSTTPS